MLFDLQVSTDASYGRMNNLVGTRSDLITVTNVAAVATNYYLSAQQINSGEGFNFAATGANVALNSDGTNNCLQPLISSVSGIPVRYYCLNLISLLGSLNSNNYFPLFACTSAPIRLEIQLVASSINAGLDILGLLVPKLYNVEYVANFLKLSDAAMTIIYASIPPESPLQFCVPDYSNYQYTFQIAATGTTSQVNFPIPAKYSSLKSLFITVRDKITGALAFYPYSSITANILNYYFRIGSTIMPTKAPDNLPEMFAEVLKAMGSMSDLNYQPSIEKSSYEATISGGYNAAGVLNGSAITIGTNSSVGSGSFYIGLDLENYVSAPKDSIFCGYNTNTSDIFAVLNFGGLTNATTLRFDAFAMFDSVIVFESQTAYRKF
jgi:hypothetical protein